MSQTQDRLHIALADEQAAERPEIRAAYETAQTLRGLYADLDETKARAESFEQTAAMAATENESLLVQLRRMKGERDHYFRAFTALSSQIEGLGSAFIKAVEMSKVHSYGERGAPPEQPQQSEQHDLPSIVRRGPAMRGSPVRA